MEHEDKLRPSSCAEQDISGDIRYIMRCGCEINGESRQQRGESHPTGIHPQAIQPTQQPDLTSLQACNLESSYGRPSTPFGFSCFTVLAAFAPNNITMAPNTSPAINSLASTKSPTAPDGTTTPQTQTLPSFWLDYIGSNEGKLGDDFDTADFMDELHSETIATNVQTVELLVNHVLAVHTTGGIDFLHSFKNSRGHHSPGLRDGSERNSTRDG
ncbi:hypothetical protein THAOC_14853 [Thalassiosira oceanica]|uniref:Uncharacterized protein n=1 Tax=Thalassiosira oceanica TaxID=159749 RepID=K0SGC5_THAOC|nr:hypothetical protein THAOC_14853 [Thalassiosira oceanica]|eukprot:EJK64415.1 hypothetical protein THAOC_14853 [Thalassiosira oceanica]